MEDVQLPSLKTRDARECLARWGLAGLRVGRFRYDFQGDLIWVAIGLIRAHK